MPPDSIPRLTLRADPEIKEWSIVMACMMATLAPEINTYIGIAPVDPAMRFSLVSEVVLKDFPKHTFDFHTYIITFFQQNASLFYKKLDFFLKITNIAYMECEICQINNAEWAADLYCHSMNSRDVYIVCDPCFQGVTEMMGTVDVISLIPVDDYVPVPHKKKKTYADRIREIGKFYHVKD